MNEKHSLLGRLLANQKNAQASSGPATPTESPAKEVQESKLATGLGILAGPALKPATPEVEKEPAEEKAPEPKPSRILDSVRVAADNAKQDAIDYSFIVDDMPKDFQEILDRFDSIMSREAVGDLDVNLPKLRDYVKKIMTELKENPEYDNLIIDRDVHNIFKFLRRIKSEAQQIQSTKAAKAETRSKKPKAIAKYDLDFGSMDLGASGGPKTLKDLSEIGDISL